MLMGVAVSCSLDSPGRGSCDCVPLEDKDKGASGLKQEALMNCLLLSASADGDIDAMRHALVHGASVETRRPLSSPSPATSRATPPCADGQADAICSEAGGEAERCGLTPLMRAAREGRRDAVQLLLDSRAMPGAQDENGVRPLHFASEAGCQACCKLLLHARASPSLRDDNGRDAFAHLPSVRLASAESAREWEELLCVARASGQAQSATCVPSGRRGSFRGCACAPLCGDMSAPSPQSPHALWAGA